MTAVEPYSAGWAVGDIAYTSELRPGFPPTPIFLTVAAIDGQANPSGGGHLGNVFNLHRVTWSDDDHSGAHNGAERIYDPAYDHGAAVAGGRAQAGWTSFHQYEEDAFLSYTYAIRFEVDFVDAAGTIISGINFVEDVNRPNDAALDEVHISPSP